MKKSPKIRVGKFGDLPSIYGLMVEAQAASTYSEFSGMFETRARAILMNAMQRHGGDTEGSTFVAVADVGDQIDGFVIGVLQPLYLVLDVLEGTDMFLIVRQKAHGDTGGRLLRAMHKWAWASPYVQVVRQGNNAAFGNLRVSGRLYTQAGMKITGNVYEKWREK